MKFFKFFADFFTLNQRKKPVKQRGAGEPDPKKGQLYLIDYANEYNSYLARKIRVIFVINDRRQHIIRAYCFHSTRLRWFKVSEISKVSSVDDRKVVAEDPSIYFSDPEKFDAR